MNEFILTLKCADARGIVAGFAAGLLELDANIIANKLLKMNSWRS